eukprot:1410420-Alexandrium_andersonii.AAC.1
MRRCVCTWLPIASRKSSDESLAIDAGAGQAEGGRAGGQASGCEGVARGPKQQAATGKSQQHTQRGNAALEQGSTVCAPFCRLAAGK